jgi:hypothetical protein
MSITTFDQYVDAKFNRANAYISQFSVLNQITANAGYYSYWQKNLAPSNGVSPSGVTGDALTNATAGAIPLPTIPGGNTLYLDCASLSATTALSGTISDRFVHTNGLNGTLTSTQAVNTVALPARATGGVGVMIALEAYIATGATPVTFTVSYTNSGGTSGRVGLVTGTLNLAGKMLPVQLDANDVGVQSVQSVTQSATSGTAGNYGVVLYKPLGWINAGSSPGSSSFNSAFDTLFAPVDLTSCISLYVHNAAGVAVNSFQFGMEFINGL